MISLINFENLNMSETNHSYESEWLMIWRTNLKKEEVNDK